MITATNDDNGEMNKVKNQVTGEWSPVPDTARHYKVRHMQRKRERE